MSRLIKDMLLLASSDADTWSLITSEVNVDTLLITLYETYEPLCARQGISLDLNLANSSYPVLHTDRERLFQILSIYMENALNHAKETPSIQIQTTLNGKSLTFSVVDHGPGIGEKEKPYIFDRFYCADRSRTQKSHFGLGLSIAKELGAMLRGKTGVEDTVGGGVTFYVTLPVKS